MKLTLTKIPVISLLVKRGYLALIITGLLATGNVSAQLEEIVVTAQKRSESVQDVPIAIQAFSGNQLTQMGIETASDVTKLAPNMTISGNTAANQQINIRGVGTSDFFGNATGSVGVYMDEVTMSAPYLTALGLYDLERVEVLRGPQNSLFGRNTTGGAVNYISKLPEVGGETEGYVSATYGNYDRIEVEGAVSLALGDTVAARIAIKSFDRDGIWNNLSDGGKLGEKDRKSIRGTLVWEPSDVTSVTASFHYAKEDSEMDPVRSVGIRDSDGLPWGPPGTPFGNLPAQIDFETFYPGTASTQGDNVSTNNWEDVYVTGSHGYELENTGGYLKIVHDMDWATFSSITSYDKTDNNWNYSLGGNSNPGNVGGVAAFIEGVGGPVGAEQFTLQPQQEHEYEQYSQEFRLVSSNDNRLRWIAGLYYFHEDADMTQNLLFGISGLPYGVGPRGGSLGIWALSGGMGNGQSQQGTFSVAEQSNEVWSPYFHTEYAVTDQLSLTVGLRYTNDSKSMDRLVLGIFDHSSQGADFFWGKSEILAAAAGDPVCDFDGDGNVAADPTSTPDNIATACNQDIGPQEPDLDFEEWGGKVGLDYQFNNNVMVYGSYSRGFRSGKHDIEFNHGPQTGWRRQNVDVEKLDAYELGFKSTLFDDTLQFNASAYFYVWNDQQQFFVGPQGPDFANIDESELKGIELEFKWAPTDTWLIMGGLGLQDTEVTASEDALVAQIGHELPFASDLSFNLVVSKDFVIGDGILTLTGDYQHRSEAKAYAFDRPYVDELRSVDFINARASYVFGPDSDYEISVFGRNLTEQKSCMYKWEIDAFSGTAYCNANEAVAFYGIQGKWNF